VDLNPAHIISITDFSPEILGDIIAHLEVSTDFDHLVYREAELDAIWSITAFALKYESDSNRRQAAAKLHAIAHLAHDLVASRRPGEAAAVLRSFLMMLPD
jgi:hypothetical protein